MSMQSLIAIRCEHRLALGSIIDVASSRIVATVDSKSFPIRANFTDDGKHVLVSNAQSGDVAVFDEASRREMRRIKMQSDTSPLTL